jgi:hypothetical protein
LNYCENVLSSKEVHSRGSDHGFKVSLAWSHHCEGLTASRLSISETSNSGSFKSGSHKGLHCFLIDLLIGTVGVEHLVKGELVSLDVFGQVYFLSEE